MSIMDVIRELAARGAVVKETAEGVFLCRRGHMLLVTVKDERVFVGKISLQWSSHLERFGLFAHLKDLGYLTSLSQVYYETARKREKKPHLF
jgi:hypothetical protein